MPVVATTRYGTAGQALALARALLNDPAGALWSDAVLLPLLNAAYRDLQQELANAGVRVLEGRVELDLPLVTAGGSTLAPNPPRLADDTTPALPADLLVPWTLEERPTGSSDPFVPMERIVNSFPDELAPGPQLRLWGWWADAIWFIGATQPVTVRIRYERALGPLATADDPVLIPAATDALGFDTAALAARSRGVTALAADLGRSAAALREKIIVRYTRPEQFKARRRRPYGWRRRVVYL
jgi:hypothetical protein